MANTERTDRANHIQPWSPEEYRSFVKENQIVMDRIYSNEYVKYPFNVETETGTVLIQKLIDPDAVKHIVQNAFPADGNRTKIVTAARNFVLNEIGYSERPFIWPTVSETLATKKADCKGRSILLLSLLLAAGQNAYAAIDNGHIWVVAVSDGRDQVVESDVNQERQHVYNLPGFYDRPLYKIFADHTVKRRRLHK